jgi:hypothetical protein
MRTQSSIVPQLLFFNTLVPYERLNCTLTQAPHYCRQLGITHDHFIERRLFPKGALVRLPIVPQLLQNGLYCRLPFRFPKVPNEPNPCVRGFRFLLGYIVLNDETLVLVTIQNEPIQWNKRIRQQNVIVYPNNPIALIILLKNR